MREAADTPAPPQAGGKPDTPAMDPVVGELIARFPDRHFTTQAHVDDIPTIWVGKDDLLDVAAYLKREIDAPYSFLYDLTAIDERQRRDEGDCHHKDFTTVYHLSSYDRGRDVRLKVALDDGEAAPTLSRLWPAANWYEREAWDMFGVGFDGHPNLRRILLPPTWDGHALRKDHPARATEFEHFHLDQMRMEKEHEALHFKPEEWGMARQSDNADFLFLNLGPNHPSAHGVFRTVLQMDGEEIIDAVPDIGYHHRGAEKMGERQSWHTYIPYTDRVDYLGGVVNELPYVLAVEQMAGIEVPDRVKVARVMLCELFRICSHLLLYGTFVQDVGGLSPVFFMFTDRQKVYDCIERITGFRMHPAYFRIGGLAMDLPDGWHKPVQELIDWLPGRLDEYDKMAMQNRTLKVRAQGIGACTTEEAIEWGMTGPNLRSTGFEWDLRKKKPYSGYDWFDFDVPTGKRGDCYDRCQLRIDEMRQSIRILQQCVDNMPAGDYKARHPLTTPPLKEYAMEHIETLIHHFMKVSWGPVIPAGECCIPVEGTKGLNSYYLTSDGDTRSYRTRIRTPSFAHLQMIPLLSRGHTVSDLVAILGSIDFVMADCDR